jgi:hypothetical protein
LRARRLPPDFADLFACLEYHLTDGFRYLERIDGARDLAASSPYYQLIAVGDAGLAVSMDYVTCE